MSAVITIDTETLTNDQIAQLVAIASQAAEAAADNTQRPSIDGPTAEKWARHMEQHAATAQAAIAELLKRTDLETAIELCNDFGAVPEFC